MSKTTVTRLFIGSGIAIVAGAILARRGHLARHRERRVRHERPRHRRAPGQRRSRWSLIGLGIVGGVAVAGGLIARLRRRGSARC